MKGNKIKAVALDVDGTITDTTRRACISAIKTIYKLEEEGIPVIIVTGNILCHTKALSIIFGTTGGLVAENGGVIESGGKITVLGDIKKSLKAYNFLKTKYDVRKVQYSQERFSEIALYRTLPTELVKDVLKDFDVEVYDSKFALHITDPLVNKGSSLEKVASDLGINTKNIMAVGDSENDIELLEVAGMKVAVANADQKLKKIADHVTTKPYGDGVAEALELLVL